MSLWWVRREQLDKHQIALIENLPLRDNFLILGPPGSGKTNVLVRRAQFVRGQGMPNVLVMTFTRPLTEFIKTGCFDDQGRGIFPQSCVTTLQSWLKKLYVYHGQTLPERAADQDLVDWKRQISRGALDLRKKKRLPQYDALFFDEVQDLLDEEVELLKQWAETLFFAGDDRQRIYGPNEGLNAVRQIIPATHERTLPFHYRVAPEICRMADRILIPTGEQSLASTCHYNGPEPAKVTVHRHSRPKGKQVELAAAKLTEQIRVYADLVRQGDRLGVVVARKADRDMVFDSFEQDPALQGKSKIIRSRVDGDDSYSPSFDPDAPICILTVKGCKGLEFRAVHWLFSDDLSWFHNPEHYYTVVTRAKTSLDVHYTTNLPDTLARAYSESGVTPW